LLAANEGFSLLVRTRRLRGYLTARLEAAFGRPVDVGHYEFSLLGGPRLEADSVTVAEDPRFGHEYFLRAERLAASLRWQSLLRGRFEFGTISFSHPSLNLVRASDGHWNLEGWLPPPASGRQRSERPARLYRIEIDRGRINFKRGVDKYPFALVDVKGYVAQEGAGRWRIDLKARPMRAAVVLQDVGTISVGGRIGGTSARLRPVDLALAWQDASLADVLRLARGQDYGVRGRLALEMAARSDGGQWSFAATARVKNLHRWDLPPRPSDPALNLIFEARWWPEQARIAFSKSVLEAPRSNVRASGFVQWAQPAGTHFQLLSTGIHLQDLLDWYRSFHPGVAEDLALEGDAGLDLQIGGWPPWIEQGILATDGARMRFGDLREPIRLGRAVVRIERGGAELLPAVLTLGRQGASFRIDAKARHRSAWTFALNVVGQTERVQDFLATAAALGRDLNHGWTVEGSAGVRVSWRGTLYPFEVQRSGAIELNGLLLRPPFLNQPVSLGKARIELGVGERRVTLASAGAFGARWTGTLRSKARAEPWDFSLAADRLDLAEFSRWLTPRSPQGLLERLLPGTAGRTPLLGEFGGIRGRGRLSAEQLMLAPMALRRLRAEVQLTGRNIALPEAQAEFYGGTVRGSLRAELSAQPVYRVHAEFDRVNLASLTSAAPSLVGRFAGAASGELTLVTRGLGHESLLRALEGRGRLRVRNAQIRGFDLRQSLVAGSPRPGVSRFPAASADFTLAAGKVHLERFRLLDSAGELEGEGNVGFTPALDLQVRLPAGRTMRKDSALASHKPGQAFRLAGSLDAPEITPLKPAARPR